MDARKPFSDAFPPAVSVVLPVFNGCSVLRRAVASVAAQTYRSWELVLVNDGSTDGTEALVDQLGATDPRLRVVHQSHAGIAEALNTGIAASRGRLICRLDADDESSPDRLAEQVAFLDAPAHVDVGVVGCEVEFGGDPAAGAGYALHVEWINSLRTPDAIALNRFIESPFAHPSVIFRRELVTRHGGYRAGNFPEDYELWLRWLDAGVQMAKVGRRLLRWNDPPGRLSRTDGRYSADAFFRLKAPWIARWLRGNWRDERRNLERGPVLDASTRILVWGAGRPTRKRAAYLQAEGVRIDGYIDVDPKKKTPAIGGTGAPVMVYDELPGPAGIFVLGYVTSRGAREFIRSALRARGYVEGRNFLMCA